MPSYEHMARGANENRMCDSPKNINIRALLMEFFGTFALVLVGVGTATTQTDSHAIAAAFGLTTAAMIYSTAFVGAGQLNPAVTFALMLTSSISIAQMLVNMFFQFVGGAVAAMFIKGFVDVGRNHSIAVVDVSGVLGSNHYTEGLVGHTFFAETTGTFILCMVVICCAANKSNTFAQTGTPLAVGFIVYALHLVLIPITSCGLNPARSAGPSLVENANTTQLWVYCVGPFTGALLAGLIGRFVFMVHDRAPGPGLTRDAKVVDTSDLHDKIDGNDSAMHDKIAALANTLEHLQTVALDIQTIKSNLEIGDV